MGNLEIISLQRLVSNISDASASDPLAIAVPLTANNVEQSASVYLRSLVILALGWNPNNSASYLLDILLIKAT